MPFINIVSIIPFGKKQIFILIIFLIHFLSLIFISTNVVYIYNNHKITFFILQLKKISDENQRLIDENKKLNEEK